LREDLELHRRSLAPFLVFWAAACVLTVVTIGRNQGEAGGTTLAALSLILPFVAGVTTSAWRTSPAVIGASVSVVNLAFSVGCQWWADKAVGRTGPARMTQVGDLVRGMVLLVALHVAIGLTLGYLGAAMTRATRNR
jgi:hypothetical protein